MTSGRRAARGGAAQDDPLETILRVLSPPRLMGMGGLQSSLYRGRVAGEELMKLSSHRHTKTVMDGSRGEGRCWHMAHWAG